MLKDVIAVNLVYLFTLVYFLLRLLTVYFVKETYRYSDNIHELISVYDSLPRLLKLLLRMQVGDDFKTILLIASSEKEKRKYLLSRNLILGVGILSFLSLPVFISGLIYNDTLLTLMGGFWLCALLFGVTGTILYSRHLMNKV
jgi:hypothetical protein